MIKTILVLVVVFVLGAVTGGAVISWRIIHKARAELAGPPEEAEPRVKLFLLSRSLGLSAEQVAALRAPLVATGHEMQALRLRLEPQAGEIRHREREIIRGVLTADQRAMFDQFMREMDHALNRPAEP